MWKVYMTPFRLEKPGQGKKDNGKHHRIKMGNIPKTQKILVLIDKEGTNQLNEETRLQNNCLLRAVSLGLGTDLVGDMLCWLFA